MKLINIFLLVILTLGFTACTKCLQCTYVNKKNETILLEKCGDRETIDAFEKEVQDSIVDNRTKPYCSYAR